MLSGVALIVVMMFDVLGVYFLSDALAHLWCAERTDHAIVLLAVDSPEELWSRVLDIRSRMPAAEIVVMHHNEGLASMRLEASMEGVRFATAENVGDVICRCLALGAVRGAG